MHTAAGATTVCAGGVQHTVHKSETKRCYASHVTNAPLQPSGAKWCKCAWCCPVLHTKLRMGMMHCCYSRGGVHSQSGNGCCPVPALSSCCANWLAVALYCSAARQKNRLAVEAVLHVLLHQVTEAAHSMHYVMHTVNIVTSAVHVQASGAHC